MKRKDFLRGLGIAGLGATVPFKKAAARAADEATRSTACVLIPTETEGPFPLDLTNNATFFRTDIREGKPGTTLKVKLRVVGLSNCLPMQNCRVHIWHCDAAGVYSGYNNAMNPGDTAATYLRGHQITDAAGEVEFTTVFPGWYNGRIAHIHFKVYPSSGTAAVSQFTWDIPTKNALYAANTAAYTKGADGTTSFASDGIFADSVTNQLATLMPNGDGTYSSFLEVAINGAGVAGGLLNYEGETGGHFGLGQNFPNPHRGYTTIPFSLSTPAQVQVDMFDLSARKVATLDQGALGTGDHRVYVDFAALGLPSGSYIYQLSTTTEAGTFRQCKMMTAAR